MKKARHIEDLFLMLAGAVFTGFTLVFPSIGFLEWFSMIPMIVGAYRICSDGEMRLLRTYFYGFSAVFAYYFVIYHWFVNLYPLDFVGLGNGESLAVVLAGWFGLSLLQAIPGGLVFLLFRLIHKCEIVRRTPILKPISFAALWVIFEWSSTLGWTGVPWGRLCLGQIRYLPMLQSASLFGSYFVSFLILLVNGLLAYCLLYRTRQVLCISLSALLAGANLMFGCITMAIPAKTEPDLCVAVIQGNINSHDKWSPSSTELTKNVYASLTRKAAEEGAKLVVWPETAFPYALNRNPSLQFFVSDLAKECEITLIVGAFYSGEDSGQYNGLYLFYPDGSQAQTIYQKRHLVPFGEYVPMRDIIGTLIPPLTRLLGACPELSPGTGSALFDTEYGEIGSLICFDSIYEQLTLDSVNDGAELMVLSSNDSWFFDSAAVYQHFAQAQLRAIESGRWILRSANTGISGIISPEGEAFLQIAPLEEGYGIYNVALKETKTVYSVIGNLFVYLCISFIVCLFATEWTVRFSDRFFPGWRKKGILREKPEKRLDNHAEF